MSIIQKQASLAIGLYYELLSMDLHEPRKPVGPLPSRSCEETLNQSQFRHHSKEVRRPHVSSYNTPIEPISVKQLLLACKLIETGGEAKRMIKQSAASIDGEKLTDPNAEITPKEGSVIRVGKRKFARLKIGG